jgi:hypothetical protein
MTVVRTQRAAGPGDSRQYRNPVVSAATSGAEEDYDVRPVYPADAQGARVQGVVIIELIDTNGNAPTRRSCAGAMSIGGRGCSPAMAFHADAAERR